MSFPRRLVADVRRAPWEAAAPLVVIVAAVLVAGFIASDSGGWASLFRQPQVIWVSYDLQESIARRLLGPHLSVRINEDGGRWCVLLLAVIVAATVAGRRRLTAGLLALLGALFAIWVNASAGSRLGYAEGYGQPSGLGLTELAITMYAVLGLVLGVEIVAAVGWAMKGATPLRTGAASGPATAPAGGWVARSRGARTGAFLAAVLVAALLPAAADWFRGISFKPTLDISYGDRETIYLLVFVMLVVFAVVPLLPELAPTVSLAALAVGSALWFPAIFLLSGLVEFGLVVIAVWMVGGLIGGLWIAARAGRASARARLADA